jgi:hypothetical protein
MSRKQSTNPPCSTLFIFLKLRVCQSFAKDQKGPIMGVRTSRHAPWAVHSLSAFEFTAPVVELCTLTAIFLGYRGHTLRRWNVFDVMSATASINPQTQLLTGAFH